MQAKLVEDFLKQFFQIYKNNDKSSYYNYIVLKGSDLYSVRIDSGHPMQWKYEGQIDKQKYNINGTLVSKPSKEMIFIFQNTLKPMKAVRDNFNVDETQHFKRGLNPKVAMGIGNYVILQDEFDKAVSGIEIDGKNYAPNTISGRREMWQMRFKDLVKGKTIYAKLDNEKDYRIIKVKNIKRTIYALFGVKDEEGNVFYIDPNIKTYIRD